MNDTETTTVPTSSNDTPVGWEESTIPPESRAKIIAWMRHLIAPTQTVELRCLRVHDGGKDSTLVGWFHGHAEIPELVRWSQNYSGNCGGVYYTFNPLRDRWGKRAHATPTGVSRMDRPKGGDSAKDGDVITRSWILIDIDPVRAKGCEKLSASDGEKEAAFEVTNRVKEYLTGDSCYWAAPVVSDSGNGYHLLFKVEDHEPTEESTENVKRTLGYLAERFDTPHATVDQKVYNPARIVKFPGTLACKGGVGGESVERPWRRAKVLEIPSEEKS